MTDKPSRKGNRYVFTIAIIFYLSFCLITFFKNALCIQVRCKAAEQFLIHIKLIALSFGLASTGILVSYPHYV